MPARYSEHALRRANQRGIRGALVQAILDCADVEAPVGSGCTSLRISRRALGEEDVRRRLGSLVDQAARTAVLWSAEGATVVTVMKDRGGAEGRRYRRAH